MAEMTDDQVNRVLAKLVGKDGHYFKPMLVRDDLAEVLAKLTPEQWRDVQEVLLIVPGNPYDTPKQTMDADHWLLTCDPAIIARAVAEVVSKEQP